MKTSGSQEKSWVSALWLITAFLGSWSSSPCAEAPSQWQHLRRSSKGQPRATTWAHPAPLPGLPAQNQPSSRFVGEQWAELSQVCSTRQGGRLLFLHLWHRAWWLMGQVSFIPMSATRRGHGRSAPFGSPGTNWARATPARRVTGCPWMSFGYGEPQCHPFNAEGNGWLQTWHFAPLRNISSVPPWWRLLWEHCQGVLSLMGERI